MFSMVLSYFLLSDKPKGELVDFRPTYETHLIHTQKHNRLVSDFKSIYDFNILVLKELMDFKDSSWVGFLLIFVKVFTILKIKCLNNHECHCHCKYV